MTFEDAYRRKLASPHDAVTIVEDGDTIVVPTGVGEPPTLLEALSDRRTEFTDVRVEQILPLRPFGYLDPETRRCPTPSATATCTSTRSPRSSMTSAR